MVDRLCSGMYGCCNVTAYCDEAEAASSEVEMDFLRGVKTIVTDSHFLVPFFVLIAGIALLVALH